MHQCLSLRRYLVQQLIGAAVINATVTGLLTWWLTKDDHLPLWGEKGLAVETLLAAVGVAVLTVLLATPAIRREARLGKVQALPWTRDSHAFLRYASHNIWGRAATFALGAGLFLAVPAVMMWVVMGFEDIPYQTFFTYKVLFVVAVGCVITPLNVFWVLTDRRPKGAAAAA